MLPQIGAALVVGLSLVFQAMPSEADWRWLDQSRAQAFERLMPVATTPGLLVAYRSYRDVYHEVPERYLRLDQIRDALPGASAFVATLVEPVGASIQQQLLDLHRSRPEASLDALLPEVRVRRTAILSTGCPSLGQSLSTLSGLSITVPELNVIGLHPHLYRFVIEMGVFNADVTLTDENAPLVRWAEGMLAAAAGCVPPNRALHQTAAVGQSGRG